MVYCLFEQSGTFKNVYKSRGINAIDIDINNEFGATDLIIDLFKAIEKLPNGILANITKLDLVIAFFPCTWFSDMNELLFNGTHIAMKSWSEERKKAYITERQNKRARAFACIVMLRNYCLEKHIPLIIENPNGRFLKEKFGMPNVIHSRNIYGDYYKKPTMYYTYNCRINVDKLRHYNYTPSKIVMKTKGIERSLMSPEYAENIINSIEMR